MTDRKLDPRALMTDIQGRAYLPVAARVLWARQDHEDWTILTEPVAIADAGYMRATIMDGGGRILATAHKAIRPGGRGAVGQYPVESAETGAIGRALGLCGYGTLAGDLDEGDQLADAPVSDAAAPPTTAVAPEPDKPEHWTDAIAECDTPRKVMQIMVRIAREEDNAFRQVGALRKAAAMMTTVATGAELVKAAETWRDKRMPLADEIAGQWLDYAYALNGADAHPEPEPATADIEWATADADAPQAVAS